MLDKKKVQSLCKLKGVTVTGVLQDLGYSRSMYTHYCNYDISKVGSRKSPKFEKFLTELSRRLGVHYAELMINEEDTIENIKNILQDL